MSFFNTCAKWFLFATNFLIFVLSCVGVGLGIWVFCDRSSFLNLLDQVNWRDDATAHIYSSGAILILVTAIAAIFLSFFGCCGASKESRCMLGTYFCVLLALLVLITVGVVLAMSQGVASLAQPFLDTLERYDLNRPNGVLEQLWDQTQAELQCCGVNSPRDWSEFNGGFGDEGYLAEGRDSVLIGVKVPESCCARATNTELCMTRPTLQNQVFVQGCFTKVSEEIKNHINIVGGVSLGVTAIMVINLFLSFYLCTCGLDTEEDPRPKKRFYGRTRQSERV